jgi:hypothetical protein
LQAVGLGLLLLLIVGVVVYALWPAKPEERFARGQRLVHRGDELVDQGNFDDALVKWYDAEHDYLEKLAQDRGNPYADQAQEQLAYMKAGTLYIHGTRRMAEKNWQQAKIRGFDELLNNYPAGNKFVEKARTELQPFEAPALLEEGQQLADPAKGPTWPGARAKLELLLLRYPHSEQAEPAQQTLDRVLAHAKALAKLEEARHSGRPAIGQNPGEKLALEALQLEQSKEPEKARAKWAELKALGETAAFRTDRKFRPWMLLAEAKLRAKGE